MAGEEKEGRIVYLYPFHRCFMFLPSTYHIHALLCYAYMIHISWQSGNVGGTGSIPWWPK